MGGGVLQWLTKDAVGCDWLTRFKRVAHSERVDSNNAEEIEGILHKIRDAVRSDVTRARAARRPVRGVHLTLLDDVFLERNAAGAHGRVPVQREHVTSDSYHANRTLRCSRRA